jgi:hypothetical protein
MDERWQFLLMASIPLAATIGGCLLTRPTPPEVLDYFYRKTRPFGLWGPVRASLNAEERNYVDRENRYDLISLPFIFVYQVTLFLIPMQIIIHAWPAVLKTLPFFLLSCAGMYWFWYRHLPDDEPPHAGLNPAPPPSEAV